MNSSDLSVGSQPMNTRELTAKAKQFDWNPRIGFKYWARAAETIHHEVCFAAGPQSHPGADCSATFQGQIYFREGNFPQAYLVLFRYSTLVLEYLGSHPEAKEPESRRALKPLQKRIPRVIELLERLRPEIDDSYERWVAISAARRDAAKDELRASLSPYARHAARDPALSWSYNSPASILDVKDHQDLAVDLAKKEMRRRRREAGIPEDEDKRRRGAGYWNERSKEADRKHAPRYMDDDELRRQMEATRRQLDRSEDYKRGYDDDDQRSATQPSTYSYPSINKSSPFRYESLPLPRPPESPKLRPVRPPKELLIDRPSPISPPSRPDNELRPSSKLPDYSPVREKAPALPPKTLAEPPKEKRITFQAAAYLENGEPIRPVFLPHTLRQRFLDIAADNTRRELEMCGVLCGTQVNNALFISHLIIPEQRCTSDTCETENESGMLNYCIENQLLVIGWIHTHPTQTCFMSSRDLHTQAGYQVMMPESFAIVCAPRHTPS